MDSNGIPETSKLRAGQEPETSQLEGGVNGKPLDFPEEVLEMIFSHLRDPKDLTAVSNASPQFNRILKPSQTIWAFKKVLPLIFSELGKKDILNCRLVSKEWNKSVDSFLQTQPHDRTLAVYPFQSEAVKANGDSFRKNHPSHRPQYRTYPVSKHFHMILDNSDDIESLMEEMKEHPRNPFIRRDVWFETDFEGEEYWMVVLNFLSKFGHHLWHVQLTPSLYENQRFHLAQNYAILRSALSFMPNLRTLILKGFDTDPYGYDADRRTMNSVKRYIRANPLPDLPHLHTFSEILPDGPNRVMAELLRKYSGQLRKLDSTPYIWFRYPVRFQGQPLSKLRDLRLSFDLCYCSWRNLCRSLVAPNLAKLDLIIWEDWEIGKLLKPLRNGLPSLVYLGLRFRARCRDFKSSAPPEFGLERIKTVEIEDRPIVEYDRILNHLPCLEYVLVCRDEHLSRIGAVNEDEEVNRNDEQLEIRRLMLSGKMYESNVWNQLKFLKEITVARMGDMADTEDEIATTEKYSRDMYNQKLEQRK